ncbi:MAG: hypothetical protein CTY35_00400 [Methylotenera sp.]|nr:MAG: hypothetical protein CTY38_00395 [Methylotenera sp.]PPD02175.1 MAG: hypothetical protein CTY35_00400 [Methylotenera sp.]
MKGLGFLTRHNHDETTEVSIWSKWKSLMSGSIQDIARGLHLGKPRQSPPKVAQKNELETLFASVIAEQAEHAPESENH